jgi:peptidoglycan/LPS O-acetylase OafA/YrhL
VYSDNVSHTSTSNRSGYLPTLDGWRALAIVAVIFHHSTLLHKGPVSTGWFFEFGKLGVPIFFAISGILICTRLLEEESRTGSLHLRGFYLRRVLRIQPASLVFLAVVLLLKLAGRIPLSAEGFVAALLLVRNYLPWNAAGATDFATLHFWSLSVEEHFYLFLPVFLLFVRRGRVRLLLGLSFAFLVWSAWAARHLPLVELSYHHTDFIVPELLVPAAVAVLLRRERFRQLMQRYLVPAVGITIAAFIYVPYFLHLRHAILSLLLVAPTVLVISTMLHPESLVGRFLEWAPLRAVGRISYGLYLWQELFFTGHFAPTLRPFGRLSDFPLNLISIVVLATASFYLIEKPCMRLGHRLARPAVEGRPELAAA